MLSISEVRFTEGCFTSLFLLPYSVRPLKVLMPVETSTFPLLRSLNNWLVLPWPSVQYSEVMAEERHLESRGMMYCRHGRLASPTTPGSSVFLRHVWMFLCFLTRLETLLSVGFQTHSCRIQSAHLRITTAIELAFQTWPERKLSYPEVQMHLKGLKAQL